MGRTPAGQTRERVFRYVRQRLLAGQPPTVREVQEHFEFRSVQTARGHLETLVREGRLTKQAGRSRGYRLPKAVASAAATAARAISGQQDAPAWVPLLGGVQAGALTEAIEDPEGFVPVTARRSDELFALRVRGESMRDAGILPDDVVIVRRQERAASGDIVVALVGDEATVKRLKLTSRRVELHPANPDFEPIVLESTSGSGSAGLRLLGKVIEVRRRLENV